MGIVNIYFYKNCISWDMGAASQENDMYSKGIITKNALLEMAFIKEKAGAGVDILIEKRTFTPLSVPFQGFISIFDCINDIQNPIEYIPTNNEELYNNLKDLYIKLNN